MRRQAICCNVKCRVATRHHAQITLFFSLKLFFKLHTQTDCNIQEKGESTEEEGPYCEECDVKFVSMEAFKRHMVMSTKHTRSTKTM